jgi:hypothetical protein
MIDTHLELEEGEAQLFADEMAVVPDNRPPAQGRLWLTSRRIVVRWIESGGLLRASAEKEAAIPLAAVVETRTPGGPLVQVIGRDGTRISLQTYQPVALRQKIADAVRALDLVPPEPTGDARLPQCPRCSSMCDAETRFCPHCGQLLQSDIAYCRRCDQEYPAHFKYCVRCGDTLATGDTDPLLRLRSRIT